MSIFDFLTMIGGLCLFLFGMDIMGQSLERRAGGSLRALLEKLTSNKILGLLTGLGITAVIQSSSATTVMVVGFVNSGLMNLTQAINVIMGANIGTTVTAWLLSLTGIDSGNIVVQLLKPSSFTPVLALIGIIFTMFSKSSKKKDTGLILLGFATLMFGMETMSGAVSGLSEVPAFRNAFILFKNPILGVLAGTILTGIIQSSSASVGILQALAATGQVSYGAAIPIIMGQNIGTCVTALLASFGANKNAKRAAFIHLFFNIIGTVILLIVFWIIRIVFMPALLDSPASLWGIAVCHSIFNIICTAILFPMSSLLEKLVHKLVPDGASEEQKIVLDERLFTTPSLALELAETRTSEMAEKSVNTLLKGIEAFSSYSPALADEIRKGEDETDKYEDVLGTYLFKLNSHGLSDTESLENAKLLKIIGDFERISDHGVNLLEAVEELREKKITFTANATAELNTLFSAIKEILALSVKAATKNDLTAAEAVEPLEQVIDRLKELLRSRHILRLQQGECTIEAGFIWSDILTAIERTSDHCSNIAGCVIDAKNNNMNIHESLRLAKSGSGDFDRLFKEYSDKYAV